MVHLKFIAAGVVMTAFAGSVSADPIKGITKPVTLTITSFKRAPNMMSKKDSIGADATTTIKRGKFNAGKYAPAVSDDVTISISVEGAAA